MFLRFFILILLCFPAFADDGAYDQEERNNRAMKRLEQHIEREQQGAKDRIDKEERGESKSGYSHGSDPPPAWTGYMGLVAIVILAAIYVMWQDIPSYSPGMKTLVTVLGCASCGLLIYVFLYKSVFSNF